jgi:hypothetical protein
MFDPEKLYPQRSVAVHVNRTTRTVRNWRERGLLPAPDVLMAGKDPAWWGTTLNASPAFTRPSDQAA